MHLLSITLRDKRCFSLSVSPASAQSKEKISGNRVTYRGVWSIRGVSFGRGQPAYTSGNLSVQRWEGSERKHAMAFPFELEPVDGFLSRMDSENDLSNVPIRRLGSESENDGYHTFRWLRNNRSGPFVHFSLSFSRARRMLMYATATDQETWQVLCKHTLGAKACCLSIGNERWLAYSHGNE